MEKFINKKAEITNKDIVKEFVYDSVVVLTVDITYPQIKLKDSPITEFRINQRYEQQAKRYFKYASTKLLKDAIAQYNYSKQNNYPIRAFDAVMQYSVTLNDNCHLSTYYDQYEYTGGAHGITYRASDNWNIQTGRYLTLKDLFKNIKNYKKIVLDQILIMAHDMSDILFENYQELIVKNFNEKSFNLKPHTLSFYYQQYEVGPYASGIITFDIPYKKLGIEQPHCEITK